MKVSNSSNMKPFSILFGVLVIARLTIAQSGSGYNYPSPFNQLTPGTNDLGNVPGVPPSSAFPGSQPGFSNQPFGSQAGGPSTSPIGPTSTLQPGYNPQFGQPTASTLTPGSSHHSSGSHGHSGGGVGFVAPPGQAPGFPAPIDAAANYPNVPVGGSPGFPGAPSKGFESGFSHSGGSHPGGSHSSGGFGSHASGGHFPGSSSAGFPGQQIDSGSGAFGGQSGGGGGNIGQPGFAGQSNNNNNFGGDFGSNGEGNGDYSAIPGTPGVDYPIYVEIPKTSFDCKNQPLPGYYADVEAQCQVFHICALNTTFNFLCPNGTIFSQEHLVCVWWNQFDCNSAPALFGNNANIYDYSKTGQQNSNQGFSGQDGGFNSNIPGGIEQQGGFGSPQLGGGGGGFGPTGSTAGSFGPTGSSAGSFGPTGSSAGSFGPTGSSAGGFGPAGPSHSQGHHSSGHSSGGFGPAPPSHSSGFSPSHSGGAGFGPASHSSGSGFIPGAPGAPSLSSGNIPSGFPAPSTGSEQYPIVPPSQIPDFNQSPVITPTIASSPTPFGISPIPTGYPAAGTPSPINPQQLGTPEQPSREYLPGRRTL